MLILEHMKNMHKINWQEKSESKSQKQNSSELIQYGWQKCKETNKQQNVALIIHQNQN